jgi:DNA-binding CsgD family transcriptional regulator
VSLETVRTHIKRTYGKLGVRSRERFFYKLAPFVIPAD